MITGFGSTTRISRNPHGYPFADSSRFLRELYHEDNSRNNEKCKSHPNLLCTKSVETPAENVCLGDQGKKIIIFILSRR